MDICRRVSRWTSAGEIRPILIFSLDNPRTRFDGQSIFTRPAEFGQLSNSLLPEKLFGGSMDQILKNIRYVLHATSP
jgi:hypothetical protein